jgi:hypothetical protein
MHMSCSPIPKRMWMWWDGWWDAKFGDFVSASRNVWVTMILMVVRCGKSRFSWPFSLKHVKHAYAFYAHQLISSTRREQNGNCNRYKSSFPECYRWISLISRFPVFFLRSISGFLYWCVPMVLELDSVRSCRNLLSCQQSPTGLLPALQELAKEFSLWSCLRHLRPFVHCSGRDISDTVPVKGHGIQCFNGT